jgi:hypothetical protein
MDSPAIDSTERDREAKKKKREEKRRRRRGAKRKLKC